MSNVDAREAAVLALYSIFYKKAYSNLELNSIIQKHKLDSVDRALCAKIVYGTIQNYYLLDYYINKFSKIKVEKMSPYISCILRMSMYQITHLSKIPHSAVCNQAAELAKKYSNSQSVGFVNAVLRNALRGLYILKPPKCKNKSTQLSLEYSVPVWMVNHFINQYGQKEGTDIIKSCNDLPIVYIRLNTVLADEQKLIETLKNQGAKIKPVEALKNAYILDFSGDITSLEAFQKGMFFVQDLSSQLCVCELSPNKGDIFIDMCSAPGSKSFTSAGLMENRGRIYAFELYKQRTELVFESAKRLGINIIDCIESDSTVFNEDFKEIADKVLVDAPCSGLGTIAKKPDIRFKTENELLTLKETQLDILNNAAKYLKKGGILVYSTCTLNKVENEDIVEEFLNNNKQFELSILNSDILKKLGCNKGYITILPKDFNSDGFFIAKMTKKL